MPRRYAVAIVLALLALCGSGWYVYAYRARMVVLDTAGPIAEQERWLMIVVVALCALVVIPTFVMLFSFAWLYREGHPRARHHYFPDWDHHTRAAEMTWWLVPTVIIAILAVFAVRYSYSLDPYKPLPGKALEVQVVALDWKWLFIYPELHVATVNLLILPVGRPVHFSLTSDAPMNSFWIPQLGGQIMAMPAMSTQLYLEASRAGDFSGYSANISGEGFAGMAFTARALPQEDFDTWLSSMHTLRNPLDRQAYRLLAAPSAYVTPTFYSPIADGLYSFIIQKFNSPAVQQMP